MGSGFQDVKLKCGVSDQATSQSCRAVGPCQGGLLADENLRAEGAAEEKIVFVGNGEAVSGM